MATTRTHPVPPALSRNAYKFEKAGLFLVRYGIVLILILDWATEVYCR